jgi:hypothetical protein
MAMREIWRQATWQGALRSGNKIRDCEQLFRALPQIFFSPAWNKAARGKVWYQMECASHGTRFRTVKGTSDAVEGGGPNWHGNACL